MLHTPITYTLKKSARARRLKIVITPNGQVTVTIPLHTSEKNAEKFIAKQTPWILKGLAQMQKRKPTARLTNDHKEFVTCKRDAHYLVKKLIEEQNKYYQFPFSSVKIKKTTTRWGSCSSKGNLNFNYHIVHLPLPLAEYLVVHELCHLKEHNHSHRFWKLVSQVIPDYKERRKQLRHISFEEYHKEFS